MNDAGCLGKHRFTSAVMAHEVGKKFGQRHHGAHCVYRCVECNGWHIGKQIPGSTASKRKQHAEKKSVDQVRSPHEHDEDGAGID